MKYTMLCHILLTGVFFLSNSFILAMPSRPPRDPQPPPQPVLPNPEPEPGPDPTPIPDPTPLPEPPPNSDRRLTPEILSLKLFDEKSHHDLSFYDDLKNGDIINLDKLGDNLSLNIRAQVNRSTKSVRFSVGNFPQRVRNRNPYLVFETGKGHRELTQNGTFTIWAVPYSDLQGQGESGKILRTQIHIVNERNELPPEDPGLPSIIGFALYDEKLGREIVEFSDLRNGDIVDLNKVHDVSALNIKAKTNTQVASVKFSFNKNLERTENSAPYTVFEENGSASRTLNKDAQVNIWAQAFSGKKESGVRGSAVELDLTFLKQENKAPPSNYDPKNDPAYKGYKYRPGEGYKVREYKLPKKPNCIVDVKETIHVHGTRDGKGCLYRFTGKWKGKSYKEMCFAPKEISEGMPPMFKLHKGARLKNVIIECALDGIHTTENNIIENVVIRDVEEDAITLKKNIVVKNSEFWFCNDKCLQMNSAKDVVVENNKFYYASTAVLANYGSNVEVRNNFFYQTRFAIRSRTSQSDISAYNNDHESGECHLMAQDKGRLYDYGSGKVEKVQKLYCEKNGGKINRR